MLICQYFQVPPSHAVEENPPVVLIVFLDSLTGAVKQDYWR